MNPCLMIIPSPLKNFTTKLFPISFLDNMCAAKKTPNKFGARCPKIILSFQHSQNIKRLKNNHLETQINAQITKDRICQ
jgi:hypothetical protein